MGLNQLFLVWCIWSWLVWVSFKILMIFLVSTKFKCQIFLQGISGCTNTVLYHVLTFEKSEKKSSLMQFHVLPCNQNGFRRFKMVLRNTFLWKFILRRKEGFMNFRIKEKMMLWISGSEKNLLQPSKLVERWSFYSSHEAWVA